MDKGAKAVGEFSLTDRRFSRIDRFMADTLFDENHGDAMGIAISPWDLHTRILTAAIPPI